MTLAENQENNKIFPIKLVKWIEKQSNLFYLTEAADNTRALYISESDQLKFASSKENIINKKFDSKRSRIREFFWPSARSMRGDCFGTKSFDETCSRAANTMAGSTIWDAVSTIPFVQFALINYLKAAALPAAITISLLLMRQSNVTGRTGANRAKGRASIANLGLAFFILLSFVKTVLSGVGFDILVNQDGITKEYAKKVLQSQVDKNQENLKELQTLNNPKLLNLQNSCQPLQDKLNIVNKDVQPKTFETVYVQAYGTYAQKQSMLGLTNEQLISKFGGVSGIPGMCNKAEAQLGLDLKQADALQEKIADLNTRIGSQPPLKVLQSDFSNVFEDEFKINKDGVIEIRSGQEVVGQAFTQFFDNIQDPDRIFQLGISLFWMGVSIILSVMATSLLWALSLTKEMKMSYNTTLLKHREDFLHLHQVNLPLALKKHRERRSQEKQDSTQLITQPPP